MDEKAPIDERLEALAQSVELMVSEGRRLQVLSDRNERRWQSQDETNRLIREEINLMKKLITAIGRMIPESEEETDGEA